MSDTTNNQGKKIFSVPVAIIIAAIIIGGTVLYTNRDVQPGQPGTARVAPSGAAPAAPTVKLSVTEEDHIRGNIAAPVTIIEFSDFQCPYCARFHPTVKQILEDYPDKVRWVYKHFPLDSIHPQARPSAEASECAAEQGKFWEFADGLLENQSRLSASFYEELAGELGLNSGQFEECVSSRKYKDRVQADSKEGEKAGVRGTPGGFVNGKELGGAVPYSYLKAAVEEALSELK